MANQIRITPDQMRERAVSDVKFELAVEKIVELEGIKASEEAINEEYNKMAEMYQLDVEKIKELVPADLEDFQKEYRFDVSCMGSVPEAINDLAGAENCMCYGA